MTIAARQVGFKFPPGAVYITSLVDGGNLLPWLIRVAGEEGVLGLGILFNTGTRLCMAH
jgi:galactitol-specific phosphotransferase system IIC component